MGQALRGIGSGEFVGFVCKHLGTRIIRASVRCAEVFPVRGVQLSAEKVQKRVQKSTVMGEFAFLMMRAR
jgi:hypothetical protein